MLVKQAATTGSLVRKGMQVDAAEVGGDGQRHGYRMVALIKLKWRLSEDANAFQCGKNCEQSKTDKKAKGIANVLTMITWK